MNEDLNSKAKDIIQRILFMTIATSSKSGLPWNSPVYFAYDEKFNLYWASDKNAQHSKNIVENNNLFIVIYDSTLPEGRGEGVYIRAKAYELSDEKEIEHALAILYVRKNQDPKKRPPQEFTNNYPRRVYKAIPEKFWINVEGDINGNFIDKREEVKLKIDRV